MKQRIKTGVDIAMTVLFLGQMGYHMMDNRMHEWTGVTLCVLFLLHHALNPGWHRGLFKGRYSASRVWLTVVDLLLTLAMVAVIVSALLVLRHAFDFLGLRMRAVGRRIHMPATMWAFVLTGLHIGLHWHIVLGKLGKAGNRAGVWLCRLVLVCVIAFGAWEFATRGLWMELFMLREFVFLEYGEPLAVFFASYAAVLYVWAALSYFLKKLLQKLQSAAQASSAEDFLTALVQLQEACGVANLKMSDYGMRKEECRTLAVNARETMGGLFLANPCELNDEDCAGIFEKAYR